MFYRKVSSENMKKTTLNLFLDEVVERYSFYIEKELTRFRLIKEDNSYIEGVDNFLTSLSTIKQEINNRNIVSSYFKIKLYEKTLILKIFYKNNKFHYEISVNNEQDMIHSEVQMINNSYLVPIFKDFEVQLMKNKVTGHLIKDKVNNF
jgi:hypothetical protein